MKFSKQASGNLISCPDLIGIKNKVFGTKLKDIYTPRLDIYNVE